MDDIDKVKNFGKLLLIVFLLWFFFGPSLPRSWKSTFKEHCRSSLASLGYGKDEWTCDEFCDPSMEFVQAIGEGTLQKVKTNKDYMQLGGKKCMVVYVLKKECSCHEDLQTMMEETAKMKNFNVKM